MVIRSVMMGLLLLLSGCASVPEEAHWFKVYPAKPIEKIVYVDFPGGLPTAWGYWDGKGTIEIKKGLPPSDEACTFRHEYAHSIGWWHTLDPPVSDCGPKEL